MIFMHYLKEGTYMKISEMTIAEVDTVLPLYIDQYNNYEDSCWTKETAGKRIRQVLNTDDSFSLIMRDDNGNAVGFVMGYFKQYDDLVAYTLDEIVVAHSQQGKGYGTALMQELEKNVREKGAAGMELQSVNDNPHERFYDRAGFKTSSSFVGKCKWFYF